MDKVKKYKEMYKRGLLTSEQLLKLKKKGVLSESELKQIIESNK